MLEKTLNALTSLIIIVDLNIQDINSFDKRVDVIVTSNLSLSEPKKRVVLVVSNFLLLIDESLLKLDFFSDIEIVRILNVALRSVLSQFNSSGIDFLIRVEDSLQKLNLLLFNSDVFLSNLIKLSDKSVDFNSIVGNLIKAFVLKLLFFNLDVFVLVFKISVLLLHCSEISLSILEIIDIVGQIRNEEFLMLRKSWCSWSFSLDNHSLFSDLSVVSVRLGLSFVALFVSR